MRGRRKIWQYGIKIALKDKYSRERNRNMHNKIDVLVCTILHLQ